MGYHTALDIAVVFGGDVRSGYYGDTHEFQTDKWVENEDATKPPARYYNANMAYDPTNEVLIMFGGTNPTDALDDTWRYKAK
jgi:hypothetical protein